MSLIAESGAGLVDAEAFCDVAFADDYFAKRNNAIWAALDLGTKEGALRLGTEYIEAAYQLKFKGTRAIQNQALSWPRYGAQLDPGQSPWPRFGMQFDPAQPFWTPYAAASNWVQLPANIVPPAVKKAACEMALRSLSGPLIADIGRQTIREKVGDLEVEYDRNGPRDAQYPAVQALLAPLLTNAAGSGSSTMKMARV